MKYFYFATMVFLLMLSTNNINAQVFPVETIVNNGSPSNKVNFLFMRHGYTASQQTQFIADVNNVMGTFFSQAPFSTLASSFNVYAVKVPSNVSGASYDPSNLIDNYFGSTYWYAGIERLVVATNSSAVYSVANASFPQYDEIFILVNDTKYGGSGGSFATFSTNSGATEIALHEAGHTYAELNDEYWSIGQEDANCTANNNSTTIKWKNFLNQEGIGIYQYESPGTGWYRPHQNCKMRYLNSPFCKVCRTEITAITNNLTTTGSVPTTPGNLSNSGIGSTYFTANWGTVNGATSYTIQRWNGSAWAYHTSTNATSFTLTGLSATSTQHWRVSASNSFGTSAYSSYSSIALQTAVSPSTPTNLTSSNRTSTSFTGSWAAVSGATTYTVDLWQGSWIPKATVSSNSYNFTGLSGTGQYFRVKANNSHGSSAYSNHLSVILPPAGGVLTPPTGLNGQQHYLYGFYLVWNTVTGATSYEVQIWQNGWVSQGALSTNYLWINTNGAAGIIWRVRSLNSGSASVYSNYIYSVIPGIPEFNQSEYDIVVYPNPTTDFIDISHHSMEPVTVELYSPTGQLIQAKTFNQENCRLNLTQYPTGLYLVKVKTDGEIYTSKIFKQ